MTAGIPDAGTAHGRFGQSRLWERYGTRFAGEEAPDLGTFKSSAANHKLGMWDPVPNGVRYLKSLIYVMGMTLSEENLARLRNTPHRELGAPYAIRCRGELMCTDYLLAVHELDFLAPHVPLDGARVLEIGAGFGRTCHTMLSNHDVESYHVLDLAPTLALSHAYLQRVLPPEQFAKIRFSTVEQAEEVFANERFDLAVNIDSMSEMDAATVLAYLESIDRTCDWFYVVNPIGKYTDPTLDNHSQGAALVELAMSTGLLRDVIDIGDMDEVRAQVPKFLDAYRPGPGWEPASDGHHPAYQHYWQGLFRRSPATGG